MSAPKDHNQVSLSYKDAGVDIDAGNDLVEKIKATAKATSRPGVLAGLGGFGGLFELPKGYDQPVLVSGTDGVGTKLRLAIEWQQHQGVGIDLVAMCVNDLIVAGAEPLFFLDYYATGDLDVEAAATVVEGIGKGCEQAGCALVGGETAEMPGMYPKGDYDLAGFCVGVVEKAKILDGKAVQVGDQLIGLASSGPHSNGYSLIRKVLEVSNSTGDELLEGKPLREHLLEPTRIYVRPLMQLLDQLPVHAMAHITGGGLLENIPRVLPDNCQATIYNDSWQRPAIFGWLQSQGNINDTEMMRTFNNGVGMVLVVPKKDLDMALEFLEQFGEQAWHLGEVSAADGDEQVIFKD